MAEPLVPEAPLQTIKSNVHITVTHGAAVKISMEEAEMLVKFAWPEIIKSEHNSFTVPKLGLSIVRDGDQLYIMTVEEKEAALHGLAEPLLPPAEKPPQAPSKGSRSPKANHSKKKET
ncbi:MAG: hypothetical protein KGH63_04175 [Candidatus Micrarchaeota archaeon]|nr:hypothetical protein [Candidatus Micrarchaeota archaeon]